MPQLVTIETGKLEKYVLPSTKDLPEADQAWVMLRHGKMQVADLFAVKNFENQFSVGIELLARRIEDWNFTDADGKKASINTDTVSRISSDFSDISFLMSQLDLDVETVNEIETDPKKNEASSII